MRAIAIAHIASNLSASSTTANSGVIIKSLVLIRLFPNPTFFITKNTFSILSLSSHCSEKNFSSEIFLSSSCSLL
ncbi:TPA: hypothetical protein DCZ31_03335 [Patescibacteria group bacterium]|nr:hypothetical protein [Candidatus Gracilibacteria bacterium]